MRKQPYSERLDGEDQIQMEELIAIALLDHHNVEIGEDTAHDLARDILYTVLRHFRPDLIVTSPIAD
jgi:hypothetical protein